MTINQLIRAHVKPLKNAAMASEWKSRGCSKDGLKNGESSMPFFFGPNVFKQQQARVDAGALSSVSRNQDICLSILT